MVVRCPTCGTEIQSSLNVCPSCGQRFGRKVVAPSEDAPVPAPSQYQTRTRYGGEEPAPTGNRLVRNLIVLVVIVVGTLLPLAYNLGFFEPKTHQPEPQADLNGLLQWEAMNDPFGAEGGSIWISGDIHNSGEIDGSGTVNMHVFDGYEWKVYHQGTGLVPKGGSVHFEYSISCDRIIVNDVQVEATIT
jgi:hypothetical protein